MRIEIIYENDKEDKLSDEIHTRIHKTALKIDKDLGVGVYIVGLNRKVIEMGSLIEEER